MSPRQRAPVYIDVCEVCNHVLPEHEPDCPLYPTATDLPPTPLRYLRNLMDAQTKQIRDAIAQIRTPLAREDTFIEDLPVDEGGMVRQVQTSTTKPKPTIQPVDVLVPPHGSSYRVITKASAEPSMVAGQNSARRSLLIVNSGIPAIGSQAAIAAAHAFIAFDSNMQMDAFWLKADAGITLETTREVWALDDGANQTVLSVIELRAG